MQIYRTSLGLACTTSQHHASRNCNPAAGNVRNADYLTRLCKGHFKMFIKILWIVGGIFLTSLFLNISQILSKHFFYDDKYFGTPLYAIF